MPTFEITGRRIVTRRIQKRDAHEAAKEFHRTTGCPAESIDQISGVSDVAVRFWIASHMPYGGMDGHVGIAETDRPSRVLATGDRVHPSGGQDQAMRRGRLSPPGCRTVPNRLAVGWEITGEKHQCQDTSGKGTSTRAGRWSC
jgi:hypothetical protein